MDLPEFHYNYVKRDNKAIFKFLEHDLRTLMAEGLLPEDIIPPKGSCAEDAYIEGFVQHVMRNPSSYPWTRTPGADRAVLEQMVREYRFLLAYEHSGRKTYHFTEGLTEGLCYTALNMSCEHLRLPYPGFAFVFTSPVAVEALHALMRTPVEEGSVITVYVREDNLDQIGFRRLLINAYETKGSKLISGMSRQLAMKQEWDIEQALRTDWDSPGMRGKGMPPPGKSMRTLDDGTAILDESADVTFYEDGLQFVRLALNGILYLTSRDAEVVEKLSRRKIEQAKPHKQKGGKRQPDPSFEEFPYMNVGASFETLPIVIDPLKRYSHEEIPSVSQRRITVQFTVGGFWRRKPNSPESAPKDVWVRPHRRGPEMADLVNRPYEVR